MKSTCEDQVVFELSDDVKNYVTDFGIANGVTARFSYLTSAGRVPHAAGSMAVEAFLDFPKI